VHSDLSYAHSLARPPSSFIPRLSAADPRRFTYLMNTLREARRRTRECRASRLCPATTTDEGIPRFSANQMSGNGNVSHRGDLVAACSCGRIFFTRYRRQTVRHKSLNRRREWRGSSARVAQTHHRARYKKCRRFRRRRIRP